MAKGNLFTRSDTMFGICQGLGEDLGFNPNYLRVALGVALVFKPEITIGVYLALGIVVLASRLLVPTRAKAAMSDAPAIATPVPAPVPALGPASRDNVNDAQALALAA